MKTTPMLNRETKRVEFKQAFDPSLAGEWCEILKDLVLMANSGGGSIFISLMDDGSPSGSEVSTVLRIDQAEIVDKVMRYTGEQFADVEILPRAHGRVAEIRRGAAETPLVFAQPGTYQVETGKQKTAFGRGAIYFRHGAKSEPGSTRDLRRFIELEVARIRKSWLGNIRKVVEAPKGHQIQVLPSDMVESSDVDATPIRTVDDPRAPAYRKVNPDDTHPYRQIDLVTKFNEQVSPQNPIKGFDVLCVRRMYGIDASKPNYYYKSMYASPQYSEAFLEWLIAQYRREPSFF
jgi:hypothetical protein